MLFPRNPLYAGYTASFAPLFRYSALLLFTPTSTVLIALPVPQLSQLTLYCICTVYWIYRICTVDVGTVFVLYSLQESNLHITHCWVLWLPERSYYICLYCICTVSLLYLYYNSYSSLCCICTVRAPQSTTGVLSPFHCRVSKLPVRLPIHQSVRWPLSPFLIRLVLLDSHTAIRHFIYLFCPWAPESTETAQRVSSLVEVNQAMLAWSFKCSMRSSFKMLSISLQQTHVRETGL